MGALTTCLKCTITWKSGGLEVTHPGLGKLDIVVDNGCPMIERSQALLLIKQLEDLTVAKLKALGVHENPELQWITRLVNEHPVFRDVPQEVKERFIEEPSMDATAVGNRKQRKR